MSQSGIIKFLVVVGLGMALVYKIFIVNVDGRIKLLSLTIDRAQSQTDTRTRAQDLDNIVSKIAGIERDLKAGQTGWTSRAEVVRQYDAMVKKFEVFSIKLGETYEKEGKIFEAKSLYEKLCNSQISSGCLRAALVFHKNNDWASAKPFYERSCILGSRSTCQYLQKARMPASAK